ncbi:MAG TPA: DUF5680 domain-containing protein [Candidatus Nanoarchaeia archaeon]|nr:DUF5680 domain-containing protein [Candidatus Nanoarchaeia archaeon]
MTMINLEELAKFLVKAKKGAYAGDGREITPERLGFKELEFAEGDWNYRDSYVGFFMAPGQEIVRFQGEPIWVMSYSGGMLPDFRTDISFAKETFGFLKRALLQIPEDAPYRGPGNFQDERWYYENWWRGNLTDFEGRERIWRFLSKRLDAGGPVFSQRYIGGLVIPK